MHQQISLYLSCLVGVVLSPIVFTANAFAQLPIAIPVGGLRLVPAFVLEDLSNRKRVGLQFEGASGLNTGKLVSRTGTTTTSTVRDPGRCVGTLYVEPTYDTRTSPYQTPGVARARFLSPTVAPAPGLRVVIRNTTPGIEQQPVPYTDRAYTQGDRSEAFVVQQDTRHHGRYLAVLPGRNTFTYQIQQQDKVIDAGSFTALITVETRVEKSSTNIPAVESNPFEPTVNPCAAPNLPEIQVPEIPAIQIPDVPPLPDIQQLLNQP